MCCFLNLDDIKDIVDIVTSVIMIIIGILGVSFIYNFKQKQLDTTFNFLSRLNVRIKGIKQFFCENKDYIYDDFATPSFQKDDHEFKKKKVKVISYFSNEINEVISFLKKEENQIPTQIGWTESYNKLIDLLDDFSMYINTNMYKWRNETSVNQGKIEYDNRVLIFDDILIDIKNYQIYIELKTAKKRERIDKYVKKRQKHNLE